MNIDINEINEYIQRNYKIKTLINNNFRGLDQINFKNKELDYPYCSFYFDYCSEWGFAPNKLLIHHSRLARDNSGSSGAMIYESFESIDELMQNVFKMKKKEEQLTIFDFCN